MTDDPDLDLILRARSGDTAAFGEIVTRHQSVLAAMLHRFAATPTDLEDLVQESFVKAWQALPAWVPEQPFLHWLKRIAARTGLEYCRRRKRQPLFFTDHLPETPVTQHADGPANAALDEARALLAQLPAEEQALLTLVHLHGMSMAEAAEHFGWSRAKAKIKAFRARHALRKILSRHGYDGS